MFCSDLSIESLFVAEVITLKTQEYKNSRFEYSPQPLTGTPLTGTLSLTGTLF